MSNPINDAKALEELSLNELHFNEAEFRDPRLDRQQPSNANTTSSPTDSTPYYNSVFERFKSISSMSDILRIFGACAVIASMSLFMLSGWDENNDTQRYMLLLGQTGLLTAAGIAISYFLKEFKGARVFFGLALISVVANFTILGSLLYSIVWFDAGPLTDYPAMVTWKVDDPKIFLSVFAFAILALPILTRFAMSIFARRIATPLTLGFLAFNCLLLVPVRGSLEVSALVALAFLAAAYLVKRLSVYQEVILTPETKFALGSLFIPGFILLARSLSLYTVDGVLEVTLSGLAYFAIRTLLIRMTTTSFFKRALEIAQYALGVNIGFLLIDLLPQQVDSLVPALFTVTMLTLVSDQMVRSSNKNWRNILLNFTVVMLVGVNTLFSLIDGGLIMPLISLASCTGLFLFSQLSASHVERIAFSRMAALVGIAICSFIVVFELIGVFAQSEWIIVGLIGFLLIVVASLYERFGLKLTLAK